MKKYLNILRKCRLFSGISDENLISMLGCLGARVDFFDKKYTVFAEGSTIKYIGIILSGSAKLIQNDYFGNRSIIASFYPSDMFAEAIACADVDSLPVSVIASEPSEIMFIDCSHVLHTCQNSCGFHQQLIFNLMKSMAEKNLMFHQKIEIISKRTTREKLMAYLMSVAKKADSNSFEIPFDRQELADYLEVDRSGLSAEISKMRKEGVLESEKNRFSLLL